MYNYAFVAVLATRLVTTSSSQKHITNPSAFLASNWQLDNQNPDPWRPLSVQVPQGTPMSHLQVQHRILLPHR